MPSVFYKPMNHIALSMPDHKNQFLLMQCDAMPSDGPNSGYWWTWVNLYRGVLCTWCEPPCQSKGWHSIYLVDIGSRILHWPFFDRLWYRIRITMMSCLKDQLDVDRSYRCHRWFHGLAHMVLMYRTAQMHPVPDIRSPGLTAQSKWHMAFEIREWPGSTRWYWLKGCLHKSWCPPSQLQSSEHQLYC